MCCSGPVSGCLDLFRVAGGKQCREGRLGSQGSRDIKAQRVDEVVPCASIFQKLKAANRKDELFLR